MTVETDDDDDDFGLWAETQSKKPPDAKAAERAAKERIGAIGRHLALKAFWQGELALERWEDFRPRFRQRVRAEVWLIEQLQGGAFIPTTVRRYQNHLEGKGRLD